MICVQMSLLLLLLKSIAKLHWLHWEENGPQSVLSSNQPVSAQLICWSGKPVVCDILDITAANAIMCTIAEWLWQEWGRWLRRRKCCIMVKCLGDVQLSKISCCIFLRVLMRKLSLPGLGENSRKSLRISERKEI